MSPGERPPFSAASCFFAFFLSSGFAPGAAGLSLAPGLCFCQLGAVGPEPARTPWPWARRPPLPSCALWDPGLSRRTAARGPRAWEVLLYAWLATSSSPSSGPRGSPSPRTRGPLWLV